MAELEQTAEPQSQPAPATEPDEFDQLLAEFTASQPQLTEQIGESAAERDRAIAAHMNASIENLQLDSKREQLQAEAQALQEEYNRRDALSAFAEIRGNLPADLFDDRMVWAWVQARNDPAIDAAFENRVADPRTYQRVLNKLAGEFGDKFRKFQSDADIDHAAVAAAVRDARGKIFCGEAARSVQDV